MASVTGELHCCDDCACAIANGDTSGLDYYGDEYRAEWEAGVAKTAESGELPEGNPVIACDENCTGDDKREFLCDYCNRNVYSHKFKLAFLN